MKLKKLDIAFITLVVLTIICGIIGLIAGVKTSPLPLILASAAALIVYILYVRVRRG